MCNSILTRKPDECPYSDLRRDLPDEPGGYICMLSRNLDGCGGDHGDCPVIVKVRATCPRCFEEGKGTFHLLHDQMADIYGCEECGAMVWPDTLQEEWKAVNRRLDHEYNRRMLARTMQRRQQQEAV